MLFPTSGRVYVWRICKEACNPECLNPTVKQGEGFVLVWATISWYSILLAPVLTLRGRVTAREYVVGLGNQVYPMMQTFPNNDAVFQDGNAPINTAGTLQS
jgi:hypothetical protein